MLMLRIHETSGKTRAALKDDRGHQRYTVRVTERHEKGLPMSKLLPTALAALAILLAAIPLRPGLADEKPAPRGVVVSVSPPANKVGEEVLSADGNAVDAAVAVGFALAVTWPEAGNIGGGGFMHVRPAGKKSEPVVIDYREVAPKAATKDLFVKQGKKAYLTVGVPGSVAGMAM